MLHFIRNVLVGFEMFDVEPSPVSRPAGCT